MEKNFEYRLRLKGLNCANCAAKIEGKTKKYSWSGGSRF